MTVKSTLRGALVTLNLLVTTVPGAAQFFPNRTITLVVPFAAGAPSDILARHFVESLNKRIGQNVVVENRSGANGMMAVRAVDRSAPDGHTLLWGASGACDPRDFRPVASIASFPYILGISRSVPARTVQDFVEYAKRNPGKLASGAVQWSSAHVMSKMFANLAGIDLFQVPYRTSDQALSDLLAGRTEILFGPVSQMLPHINAGGIRALAVTGDQRLEDWDMRSVPTLTESGFPKFPPGTWIGVLAPSNTPEEIVNKLNGMINEALTTNEFRTRLQQAGGILVRGSSQDFAQSAQRQAHLWSELIKLCPECTDVNCTLPKKPCSYDSSMCCEPK